MKYKDLNSKQRANYWALTSLLEIIQSEIGDKKHLKDFLFHIIKILSTNLDLELYTEMSEMEELRKNVSSGD